MNQVFSIFKFYIAVVYILDLTYSNFLTGLKVHSTFSYS